MPNIKLEKISFTNADRTILSELSLTIAEYETIILAGSGEAGRSILLKIMAGILAPTSGKVLYDDIDIFEANPDLLKKLKRQIGFTFQIEGLLSNLSIEENILLPIKFFDSEMIENYYTRINEILDFFSIADTWHKRPAELSMQKKKILAFIRSIIMNPRVLFLDDPYFTLDQFYQKRMLEYIKILKDTGITLVIVTNSEEIMYHTADKVLFFRDGRIVQEINRSQINPETLKKMEFLFNRS